MVKNTVYFLLLNLIPVLTSSSYAGDRNLVGYWKLDEMSGQTAEDSGNNRNHGKLIGSVTWAPTEGKFGGAASFDGTDNKNRIEISGKAINSSAGTLSLWVRLAGPQSTKGRDGYRFLFGMRTGIPDRGNRLQLYMNENDTQLDIGLGDNHWKEQNIVNLNVGVWHNVVLTWRNGDYAVYINGIQKAVGTYSGLNSSALMANIGNNGDNQDPPDQPFHGLMDEVAIFDDALNENEIIALYNAGVASFIETGMSKIWSSSAQKAEEILEKQKPQEAIVFIEKELAECEQQKEKEPNETNSRGETVLFELRFLLAKAKEAAGLPLPDVVLAYKQAAAELVPAHPNSAYTLVWLYEHLPGNEYQAVVKAALRNFHSTHNKDAYKNMAHQFESNGNWAVFELFLDTLFNIAENPIADAKSIGNGLSKDGAWQEKYLQYARGKKQLTEYVFEMDCKIAEKYKAEQNFDKAVSYYRDIMTRYEDGLYKPLLELKVFECIFDSGEYQTAIAEIDKFVTKNKAGNRELSQKAILMKGQCYIQSGEIEKALNEFNRIMTEYPELKQTPELVFFTGYCFMQQGKNDKAIEAFNSVIQNHPQSKYANNARLCIAQIRNKPDKTE